MPRLALLMSLLLLGGCTNMVRSQEPWFGPADGADGPLLREGVWAALDPDCRFDANTPLEQWPACAQARVIRGGEELALSSSHSTNGDGRGRPDYVWASEAFVLAAGTPRIHQRACGEPRGMESVDDAAIAEPADEAAVDAAVRRLVYCYAGLRTEALDAEGRIVAFTTWPIWCGPLRRDDDGEDRANVTDAPFPGLVLVGDHCVAADVAALRAAAAASETILTPDERSQPLARVRFRWIRDGWR